MTIATDTTLGEIKLAGDIMPSDANYPQITPSGVKPGNYPFVQKVHIDGKGRVLWIGSLTSEELSENIMPYASPTVAGAVKVGNPFSVTTDGLLSIDNCSATEKGVMQIGSGLVLNQSSGAVDAVLPVASNAAFGSIKITELFDIAVDGTLSVNGQMLLDLKDTFASTDAHGAVIAGDGFIMDNGELTLSFFEATTLDPGFVIPGTNFDIDTNSTISVKTATTNTLGVVRVKDYDLAVDGNGELTTNYVSQSAYGKVNGTSGPGLSLDDSTHTLSATYSFIDIGAADATDSVAGKVQIGANIDVNGDGLISLPTPTLTAAGPVKVTGRVLKIDGTGRLYWDTSYYGNIVFGGHVRPDGSSIYFSDEPTATIAANFDGIPAATTNSTGIMQVGSDLNVTNGVISIPVATTTSKGTIIAGSGISIFNGIISQTGQDIPIATTSTLGAVRVNSSLKNHGLVLDGNTGVMSAVTPTRARTSAWIIANRDPSWSFGNQPDYAGVIKCDNSTNVKVDNNGILTFGLYGASAQLKGPVKVDGVSLQTDVDGTLSVPANGLYATATKTGIAKADGTTIFDIYRPSPPAQKAYREVYLPLATTTSKGVIKYSANTGIDISSDGIMQIAKAKVGSKGIMQPGYGLTISAGKIAVDEASEMFTDFIAAGGAATNVVNEWQVAQKYQTRTVGRINGAYTEDRIYLPSEPQPGTSSTYWDLVEDATTGIAGTDYRPGMINDFGNAYTIDKFAHAGTAVINGQSTSITAGSYVVYNYVNTPSAFFNNIPGNSLMINSIKNISAEVYK